MKPTVTTYYNMPSMQLGTTVTNYSQENSGKEIPEYISDSSEINEKKIKQRDAKAYNRNSLPSIELLYPVPIETKLSKKVIYILNDTGANILNTSDNSIEFEFDNKDLPYSCKEGEYSRLFDSLYVGLPINDIFPIIRALSENPEKTSFQLTWGRSNVMNHHWHSGDNDLKISNSYYSEFSPEYPNSKFVVSIDMGCGAIGGEPYVDYFSTTGVATCYVIIFWDSVKKSAIMTHHECSIVTAKGIEKQLKLLIDNGSMRSNIEAKVVGGLQTTVGDVNGFFNLIMPTLEKLKIPITETMIGFFFITEENPQLKERPSDILFDIETGRIHSILDSNYLSGCCSDTKPSNSTNRTENLSKETCYIYDCKDRFSAIFREADSRA